MINGPSLFNLRTALPTANPGTAGSPGFSRVLSETDAPLPAQPGAGAPQRPGLDAPRSQEAPKSAKPTEPPPAHNPGGRMEQPPTAARPITAQRPATRTAAAPQEQKASPASDASNAPAPLTSTTGQPNDESALAEAASADTPPSLQALLAALQPSNEPAPALAWGALTGGQDPAATASEEPKTGRGTVHGRLHLAAETTTALAGTTALGEAAAATLKGLAAADPLATHSETHSDAQSATSPAEATTPITLPMTSAEATASALSGPGLALPQASVPAPGAAPATSNLPAAQAQIAASPDSPAFAPELGAQISTFVRQGVERAQLQLHPAEMGPVTVQILVEGAAAQVRLWADQPGTRLALEQAMPTLAGQLRESGLTLTGGGVFEQAQQTPEQAWHEARHGNGFRRDTPAEPAGPSLAAPTRRRGVVDLIA